MPSLGADMEAGTLTQWLVKPGDEVHRGDIVAVVDTDKSTIEVEIFESGVITDLVVGEGELLPVGTVLAHVGTSPPATLPPERSPSTVTGQPSVHPPDPAATATGPPVLHSPVVRHLAEHLGVDPAGVVGSGPGGQVTRIDVEHAAELRAKPVQAAAALRVRSSPRARRLAADLGLELAEIPGSGPGGSVIARDIQPDAPRRTPAREGAEPAPQPGRSDRQTNLRQAIASLMTRSKREIPHYYLSTTIDVTPATSWLGHSNLSRAVDERLVLPALLIKATALAVAQVPEMNGFCIDGVFTPSGPVHVGLAVSLRSGGVVAPAIHDADRLTLDQLMSTLRALVGRARAGVMRSSEMSDPTITVTNLGELGVEAVFGVIYPPQVALVGFGQVTERPVARDGMVGARPCLTATLAADHRVSDGHRGGRFLAEINHLLQEPEKL